MRVTHSRSRRFLHGSCLVLAALALLFSFGFEMQEIPEQHADILDHFKYGSIGAEERAGLPYWIWRILPEVFEDLLPVHEGKGYARFGWVFESESHSRPIGTSYRERMIPFLGVNCAVCHAGTLRESPSGTRRVILGMPSHQFDFQAYFRFLIACARDRRFESSTLIAAMRKTNPKFSWIDSLLYRFFVIERTRNGILQQAGEFAWTESRPQQGPGRVDTFNPYKRMFDFDMTTDATVGTADLPSLWNQKLREGMWLHWDGNNNAVTERNKSAAIGAGASESSLDLPSMKRIEDWIRELKPPSFPAERIDRKLADEGQELFSRHCASCHSAGGERVGQVTPLEEIGTDAERLRSFTPALAERMNTLGMGRSWRFSHFRKTQGYANMPLDGLWLRAPYLHNGSVPTLTDLLAPMAERPTRFYRGYDVYDFDKIGFISDSPEAARSGFQFDTWVKGNGNQGHSYGTDLPEPAKRKLLEYLKTL